jgi:adenylate cyclase
MGTSRRVVSVRARRRLPATPAVAFGVLSDSNRWDRLLGFPPSRYTYARLVPDDPLSRVRIGHIRRLGVPQRFVETGEYWAPERFRGERRYVNAWALVIARAQVEVTVRADGDGSHVEMTCRAHLGSPLGWLVALVLVIRARLAMRRYLAAVERALASAVRKPDEAAPPGTQARRVLLGLGDAGRAVTGPRAAASRALAARAARFADAPIDAAVREKIVDLVASYPDESVVQAKPFELAAAWGLPRREVLRGFLHATRAGLVDLEWQIDCPTCRVGASWAPTLDALGRRVHCEECDIAFDVDFADHVEATFTVNAAVRAVPRHVWCAGSPYWRPHVHGYVVVKPGTTRDAGALPPGPVLLRVRGLPQLKLDGGPARVKITDTALVALPTDAPGLTIENASARTAGVQVERAGWAADRARGSLLVTVPDYISLFGTEAPAAGMQLSVGTVATLFTDVVGSTELYEHHGDARAFAIVQRHWRACEEAAARHGGAVVKTLGDGLMCCFPSAADATAAAFAMIEAAGEIAASESVRFAIRAAAHEGPCFVVRANDRLDLFGATVNLASRLLGSANASQLALVSDAARADDVDALVAEAGAPVEHVETALRGLRGTYAIAVVTYPGAAVFSTGRFASIPKLSEPAPTARRR